MTLTTADFKDVSKDSLIAAMGTELYEMYTQAKTKKTKEALVDWLMTCPTEKVRAILAGAVKKPKSLAERLDTFAANFQSNGVKDTQMIKFALFMNRYKKESLIKLYEGYTGKEYDGDTQKWAIIHRMLHTIAKTDFDGKNHTVAEAKRPKGYVTPASSQVTTDTQKKERERRLAQMEVNDEQLEIDESMMDDTEIEVETEEATTDVVTAIETELKRLKSWMTGKRVLSHLNLTNKVSTKAQIVDVLHEAVLENRITLQQIQDAVTVLQN